MIGVRRYRKKAVVVEAIQNVIGAAALIVQWCDKIRFMNNGVAAIETTEGVMTVSVNDWIILGTRGEFYPCKPDVFEDVYNAEESDDTITVDRATVQFALDCLNERINESPKGGCFYCGYAVHKPSCIVPSQLKKLEGYLGVN